jgi:hypothetical protein
VASHFARVVTAQPNFIYQRVELSKHSSQSIVKLLPLRSQNEWAFRTIDQPNRQEIFQVLDALAGRALSHSVFVCCERKAPLSNHIVEYLQGTNMHRSMSTCGSLIIFIDFFSPLLIATIGVYLFFSARSMINLVKILLPWRLH